MSSQSIHDDSGLRRYRTEIPNIAVDRLDPYALALYVHYKRVAGPSGACWEETATTAERCQMSHGKVVATRRQLAEDGWITIEERPRAGKRPGLTIRIVDRWRENMAAFAPVAERELSTPRGKPDDEDESAGHVVTNAPTAGHVVTSDESAGHVVTRQYRNVKKEPVRSSKKQPLRTEEGTHTDERARGAIGAAVVDKAPSFRTTTNEPDPQRPPAADSDDSTRRLSAVLDDYNATLDEPFSSADVADMAAAAARHRLTPSTLQDLILRTRRDAANPPGWLFHTLIHADGRPPRPKRPARRGSRSRAHAEFGSFLSR